MLQLAGVRIPVGGHRARGRRAEIAARESSTPSESPSSIGSPVKRTVLAMARSSVRARAGEIRRARQRHAAVVAELAPDAADRVSVRARMPAAAIASVTRIVRLGALRAHHRLHRRRRQVMAIDDQAGEHRVGRQQLPDRRSDGAAASARSRCPDASRASRRRRSRRRSVAASPRYGRSRRARPSRPDVR